MLKVMALTLSFRVCCFFFFNDELFPQLSQNKKKQKDDSMKTLLNIKFTLLWAKFFIFFVQENSK